MKLNIKIGIIFIIFIWGTFFAYSFGAVIYPDDYRIDIAIYLFFICAAFYWGCYSYPIQLVKPRENLNARFKYFNIILLTSIIISVILVIENISKSGFQLSLNIGEIYRNSHRKEEDLDVSRIGQIVVIFSPIRILSMCLGAYVFMQSTFIRRLLILANLFLYIFYEVFCLGTQKGVGNVLIISLISIFLYFLQVGRAKQFYRYSLIFFLVFLAFFIFSQSSRADTFGGGLDASVFINIDPDNIFYKIFGKNLGNGLIIFIFYLTHGYHGLGYCLQLPFEWTHFYGSSFALSSYLEQYFGFPSLVDNTYPLRMQAQFNWPGLMFWPTAFAWLASDFTFPGVVVLMFFLGRLFCICFKEVYLYANPISLAILSYLTIMIIYLPSNNQIFQTRESFFGIVTLFSFWLIKHKKYNYLK